MVLAWMVMFHPPATLMPKAARLVDAGLLVHPELVPTRPRDDVVVYADVGGRVGDGVVRGDDGVAVDLPHLLA